MADLRDLYQEVILDHTKRPRNFRALDPADRKADGFNPLCGDRITVYLRMDGERVRDITFQGAGCAISTASASMMTEKLKGMTASEIQVLFERFHDLVTGKSTSTGELGKLAAFSGVSEFPIRVKCASLAWHAMKAALEGSRESVSTE